MSTQSSAAQSAVAEPPPALAAPSLPDLNAETYPFDVVQRLLDQVAYFNIYATPDRQYVTKTSLIADDPDGAGHGGCGLVIGLLLHPFDVAAKATDRLSVTQEIGAAAGRYRSRWMFAPPDYTWSPGERPPATQFDPTYSQDFVMLGDRVVFGEKERHGFFGYGVGRTFVDTIDGEAQLWAGAVGNITQGFGKFEGLQGVYVFNGAITRDLVFEGNLTFRILDADALLQSDGPLPVSLTGGERHGDAAYIMMSGRKPTSKTRTEYGPQPLGWPHLVSIVTPAKMSAVETRFTDKGRGGLRSEFTRGELLGSLEATITLDILAPPGTAASPTSFTTHNYYQFLDLGGVEIGTITAGIELGRAFGMTFPSAPGQRGLRYGGVGRITDATGAFAGARGLLSVNSAIGIFPHVLSVLQLLRIVTPRSQERGHERCFGPDAGAQPTGAPPVMRRPLGATTPAVSERDLVLRTGERMHYREAGSPDGPTILMLHGNPAYSLAWTPVMERLADLGHLIAPDLMGFGDSEKPRIIPSYFNHTEYLDEFIAGLGLRDLTLFIQDWGGALGFDHAVRHPGNVRGIAFFEVFLKPYESWDTFPQKLDPEKLRQGDPQQAKSALARQKFQDFRGDGEVGDVGWQAIAENNVFLTIFMGPLLGHPFDPRQIPDPLHDPVLGPLLAPYARPFPTTWSRNSIWRLTREIPVAGSPPDTTATVSRFSRIMGQWSIPKLLIYSDKGPTLKEEHALWVRQNWSGNLTVCNLDQVPGVQVTEGTHFFQQVHPEELARFFREWFVRLR